MGRDLDETGSSEAGLERRHVPEFGNSEEKKAGGVGNITDSLHPEVKQKWESGTGPASLKKPVPQDIAEKQRRFKDIYLWGEPLDVQGSPALDRKKATLLALRNNYPQAQAGGAR